MAINGNWDLNMGQIVDWPTDISTQLSWSDNSQKSLKQYCVDGIFFFFSFIMLILFVRFRSRYQEFHQDLLRILRSNGLTDICDFSFSPCLWPSFVCPTHLSVEAPEGEELSSPDHWLVPVLPQLWDGCFFSNNQQEPPVQAGARDESLHRAALLRPNSPHQGEVNRHRA